MEAPPRTIRVTLVYIPRAECRQFAGARDFGQVSRAGTAAAALVVPGIRCAVDHLPTTGAHIRNRPLAATCVETYPAAWGRPAAGSRWRPDPDKLSWRLRHAP
ncbi:hypothetical protein D3C80_1852730 [compost metagenome]